MLNLGNWVNLDEILLILNIQFYIQKVSFVYLFHDRGKNEFDHIFLHRIYHIRKIFSSQNELLPCIDYSSKLPLGILIYLKEEDTFHYLPPCFHSFNFSSTATSVPLNNKVYIYISLILPARRWLLKFISARWSLHRGRLILQVFHIHFL